MRQVLVLLLAFLWQYSYAQNIRTDTTFKVIYDNKKVSELEPAYFLNDRLVNGSILTTLDQRCIDKIMVDRHSTTIGSKTYRGQIHITTKKDNEPDLVSLTSLKSEYSVVTPTVFMINDEIVERDYDDYFVDQDYILRIIIKPVEISKEGIRFNLIQILTKTDDNIAKVNAIRLRGDETLTEE